jgi:hypothetical protein
MQPLQLIVSAILIVALVFVDDVDLFRVRIARPLLIAVLLASAVLLAPTKPEFALLCTMLMLEIAVVPPAQPDDTKR